MAKGLNFFFWILLFFCFYNKLIFFWILTFFVWIQTFCFVFIIHFFFWILTFFFWIYYFAFYIKLFKIIILKNVALLGSHNETYISYILDDFRQYCPRIEDNIVYFGARQYCPLSRWTYFLGSSEPLILLAALHYILHLTF